VKIKLTFYMLTRRFSETFQKEMLKPRSGSLPEDPADTGVGAAQRQVQQKSKRPGN
jgi:hypothetical protein